MSTKHNTLHPDRAKSNYKNRLTKRGLSKAPALTPLDTLVRIQENRIKHTCTMDHEHYGFNCNGFPWYQGNDTLTGAES